MSKELSIERTDNSNYYPALEWESIPKTLILVPDLALHGGVAHYYKTLKLDDFMNARYFEVNSARPESAIGTLFRLGINYFRFLFILIKDRYRLIHVNPSLERRSFYRDAIFILIARLLRKKILIFFRGWIEPFEQEIKKSKWKSFLFRLSFAKADKYIVLSNLFKNKMAAFGVKDESKFFIETTVADTGFLDKLDMESKYQTFREKINFLYLSRLEKEKGIYIAIDAYKIFLAKNPPGKSSLLIAGDGPDIDKIKKYVTDQNIPNVEFAGHVSGEKKGQVLLKSHILIFPSYTEGMPNAILEAMLYGMPVISREIGAIPDIISQGENGYLTSGLDPDVFAGFLAVLASDEALYKKIAATNHNIALEKFTTAKVRERILDIYRNCVIKK